MDFKHELEYYLFIFNDNSLSYQDKVKYWKKRLKKDLKICDYDDRNNDKAISFHKKR